MSESGPAETPRPAGKRLNVHLCAFCPEPESGFFGFTTASGTVWTCGEHRPQGEALRVREGVPARPKGQGTG
jgi:hypothetical protein